MTAPDLPAFLLARIAEDEAAARAASDGRWYAERREPGVLTDETRADVLTAGSTTALSICVVYDEAFGGCSTVDAAHIARHDPARVLAECAAKRAVVEHCAALQTPGLEPDYDDGARDTAYEVMVRLAQPYAAHPDLDPSWRV